MPTSKSAPTRRLRIETIGFTQRRMTLTAASYIYFAIASGLVAFSFWKPQFPGVLALWLCIRDEKWRRRFILIYWIAVPVVMYRFLHLGLAAAR